MRLSAWLCGVALLAACGDDKPPIADATCTFGPDCPPAHAICDWTAAQPCTCVAGYTMNGEAQCVWTGVVVDPGFQTTTAWSAGGARIGSDVNGQYDIDPGVAEFSGNALCNLARVTQTLTMPKYSLAEPLVIETRFRPSEVPRGLAVGIGGVWHNALTNLDYLGPSGVNQGSSLLRTCLGPEAYAPESSAGPDAQIDLAVMPSWAAANCADPGSAVILDHVEIKPAGPGQCPTPGTANNGDFEGDGGWDLQMNASGSPGATTVEEAVGEGGTRGAHFHILATCVYAVARDRISIPTSIASPAISYYARASAAMSQEVVVAGLATQIPVGTAGSTTRFCLPPAVRGSVQWFDTHSDSFPAGTCFLPPSAPGDVFIDNLKVVDDPACGTNPAIADPGFEAVGHPLLGAKLAKGDLALGARAVNDPTNAHSGNGVLELSADVGCQLPAFVASVRVPRVAGPDGPALEFFYKAPPPGQYTFAAGPTGWTVAGAISSADDVPIGGPMLVRDSAYHRAFVCLDPKLADRAQRISFALTTTATPCTNRNVAIPRETAFVDDLAVTTDPSCPAM